ncbi:hypothetical protein SPWS13_4124 [Shewanella putrefaciens]|nr:hypothetical protein SPWS13_4124 [Shewanella putrefaciens]
MKRCLEINVIGQSKTVMIKQFKSLLKTPTIVGVLFFNLID